MKKNTVIIACLLAVTLAGCAPMTRRKQIGLACLMAAQAADGYTTNEYLRIGGTEANPLLDDRPSRDQVWLFKGLVTLTLYGLGEIFEDDWEFFYGLGIAGGGVAAVHNNHLYEKWR